MMMFFKLIMITWLAVSCTTATRQSRRSLQNLAQLAFAHGVKVQLEGACREPKAQIVYVDNPNPAKVYLPRGTILHRCSDETGCCADPMDSCQAVHKEQVSLYFITYELVSHAHHSVHGHRGGHRQGKSKKATSSKRQNFEKLTFTNHTMCACRPLIETLGKDEDDDDDNGVDDERKSKADESTNSTDTSLDDDLNGV
ncbi:hypothetical protein HDE_05576 [Halotydeus destructor]|nr:hypothetical protein HDE_05576 [Halotydeus destructor]